MEHGTMSAEGLAGDVKWRGDASVAMDEMTISNSDWSGHVEFSGHRCKDCRQLVLKY
jgi:hypothetical protein